VWHKRGYPEKLGATLHRYADDAILVCRKSGAHALQAFEAIASRMGLTINCEKTRITKLIEGFDFIGFEFVWRKSGKPVKCQRGKPGRLQELRWQILQRDGWHCQRCGGMTNLEVHHLQFKSHQGEDTEQNLVTLCSACHKMTHSRLSSNSPRIDDLD
jgi:hypothetical protein